MKKFLFIILGTLLLQGAFASNSEERPEWTYGYFKDATYSYIEVVSASAYDKATARQRAMEQIIKRRSLATGTEANVSYGSEITVKSSDDLIAKARVVDEYVDYDVNGYTVYLLVQTAKNPDPKLPLEKVTVSEKYPFSARVFVPGMAQIYKGSIGKGAGFITGEVVFIGGIVVSECLRLNYQQQINSTHNAAVKQQYLQYANTCAIVRNVSIAGAVAVYAWNIIDGIVAKGKKQVFIGDAEIRFAPYASSESLGLAMRLNF